MQVQPIKEQMEESIYFSVSSKTDKKLLKERTVSLLENHQQIPLVYF